MIGLVFIFFITILVAYILGITLVSVVDKRLSNISIKVPKQNVTVNMEQFSNSPFEPTNQTEQTETDQTFEPNTKPTHFADIQQQVKDMKTPPLNGVDQFRDYRLRPDLFNQSSPPESTCQLNHAHKNCSYGPTNYPDPLDMSQTERRAFATNYPQNLTLQDYTNWLWTNKHNTSLSEEHTTNLNKLKSGTPLRYQAGQIPPPPKPYPKAHTAAEHFTNLYKDGIDLKYSITSPLHDQDPNAEPFTASNYEDAESLSDANHLGTPCDTTVPDRSQRKMNAHTLFRMTTPQIRPERFVHTSPAEPIKNDHLRV